jgi:hypothetical protein
MAPCMGTRAAQPGTSSGLGTHFSSPRKLRDKRKTKALVEVPGQKAKQRQLLAKMASLLAGTAKPENTSSTQEGHAETVALEPDAESSNTWEDVFHHDDVLPLVTQSTENCPLHSPSTLSRRILPNLTSTHLYDSWKSLIPTLVAVQLNYTARTLGAPLQRIPTTLPLSLCRSDTCAQKRTSIVCLFFDRKYSCI